MTINLKQERLNRGLTVAGLAQEIGISPSALQRAEAGRSVHPANAKSIADYFEMKVTDIWPLDEEPAAA